jgi:CrcB protein
MKLVWIGIAGLIGAAARFGISKAFNPYLISTIPVGTLLCNYIGCLLLGILSVHPRLARYPMLKTAIASGGIGAFTTFSAFSIEMVLLMEQQLFITAVIYGLLSLFGGLAFAALGQTLVLRSAGLVKEADQP